MKSKKNKNKNTPSKIIKSSNPPGRPRAYTDEEVFDAAVETYFKYCDEHKKKYTYSGLALCLGIDVKTLRNYRKDERFFPSINRARLRIMDQYEQELFRTQGSTNGVQFALKNNFDEYKDEQVVQNNILGSITIEDFLKDSGSDL